MLLRQSQHNDIEIPYNCAGVLANILSDGCDGWTIGSSIDMAVVNQEMFDSIQNLGPAKTTNDQLPFTVPYSKAIERELSKRLYYVGRVGHDQSNYCSSYVVESSKATFPSFPRSLLLFPAEKYCTLVRNENGEPLLSQILYSEKLSQSIKSLAEAALANVQR